MARRKTSRLVRSATLLRKATRTKRFARWYLVAAIALLGVTTVFWSVIGALIQGGNADQIANTLLLGDPRTAAGMTLPAQHTFLLKVPLFWLVSLFGSEPWAFLVATVLLSLLTVAGIAVILSRIERRPLVLGTVLLALSAVLLFIPAQSYPGALLPVNMAMLTTRNIEYVLFAGALILTIRAARWRSVGFIAGCVALTLLFSSDKLFLSLAGGTAIVSGVFFLILRRRDLLRISVRILGTVVIAYAGSLIVIALLRLAGVHIDNGPALGPYGLTHTGKDLLIALVYAPLGILTNLGANPAYATMVIRDIPAGLLGGLLSPAGPGYIVTIGITVAIVRATIMSVRGALKARPRRRISTDWRVALPVLLLATSISAVLVFIVSNHYYPADARYLGIVLITGFVALTVALKGRVNPPRLATYGLVCGAAILFGVFFQFQNVNAQNQALSETNQRNDFIASALKSHPVGTLLGSYWRVLPIRLNAPTLGVTPLENCTTERTVLSSSAWRPDLTKTGFAYLLQLDGSLANGPDCTLDQVTSVYGRPDSSIVVAGTRSSPKELLLFYDQGIHLLKSAANTDSDTVTPVSVDTMPFTTCANPTVMQFSAHEDDDILFMNPDLLHSLKAGNCVRSVFFTAGDAGADQLYWLSRQHGAEAAYNSMLGTPDATWTERVVALDSTHLITVANPRGNHNVSLIFLHLPDGNPQGTGFPSENFESLHKLYDHQIPSVHSVEDPSTVYSYTELTSALLHLMNVYKPAEIRTQSTDAGTDYKDHSDHTSVGEFTTLAYGVYSVNFPQTSLTYYLGYPVHDRKPNVSDSDYDAKVAAFLAFGSYDHATCRTLEQCNEDSVYGIYLRRQYTSPF